MRQSLQSLPTQADQKTILLGGDFNAPEIDWKTHTIRTQAKQPTLHQDLLNIVDDQGLTQTQTECTRGANVLDLCCSITIVIE